MKNIFSKSKENIISLLFSVVGAEILFYSMYRGVNIFASINIAILTVLLYLIFDKVVEEKRKGTIIYLITGILMLGLSYVFIKVSNNTATVTFYAWALTGGKTIGNYIGYIIGGSIFISFLFSSLTYYFSVNNIRMPMMFLLAFVVSVLYTKNVYKINSISLAILSILLFLLFLRTNKTNESKWKVNINVKLKHSLLPGISLVLVVFIIASTVPMFLKLPKIKPLEGFKGFINGSFNNSGGNSESSNNKFIVDTPQDRDINKSSSRNSKNVLYSFIGDDPSYLIDHTYSIYKNNKWEQSTSDIVEDPQFEKAIWEQGQDVTSKRKILEIEETISYLNNFNNLDDKLNEIKNTKSSNDLKKELYLKISAGSRKFLTHPVNTSMVVGDYGEKLKLINDFELLYKNNGQTFNPSIYYNFSYMSDNPSEGSKEEKIMKYMNMERYFKLIEENLPREKATEIKSREVLEEQPFSGGNRDIITERMEKLAQDLTVDSESVYDKALSIERYFTSGKYKYNLTLPESKYNDNYIDFLIFDGKEGYCIQYATAMTLLCRAAGIPAKYVEGYSITAEDYDGKRYNVKESNGHAFVQVHIPGYGWKIFDPTPSIEADTPKSSKSDSIKINPIYILIALLVIGIVVGLILLYLYLTKRKRFLKRIYKLNSEEAFEVIMKDSINLLEGDKIGLNTYNGETLLNFAKRVDASINIGFTSVVNMYYGYRYAFNPFDKIMLEEAIKVNEHIYRITKER